MSDDIPIYNEALGKTDTVKVTSSSVPVSAKTSSKTGKNDLNSLILEDAAAVDLVQDLNKAKIKADEVSPKISTANVKYNYSMMALDILKKSELSIDNPAIIKRLELVLKSFLEKARKMEFIADILQKKIQDGGLGMDKVKSDKVILAIKEMIPENRIPDSRFLMPELPQDKILSEVEKKEIEKTVEKELKGNFVPPESQKENPLSQKRKDFISETVNELTGKNKSSLIIAKDAVIPIPNKKEDVSGLEELKKLRKEQDVLKKEEKKEVIEESKPLITQEARLVGPIEELKYTFDNFRMLAKDVKERTKKIEAKIKLLEEESITNKYLGIKAWISSDVFRNYIEIGEKSLQENRTVDNIIDSFLATGKNTLKKHEFEAVADLNSRLRI